MWPSSADQNYQIKIKEILFGSCLCQLKINAQSMNRRLYCLKDHTLVTTGAQCGVQGCLCGVEFVELTDE